VRWDARSALSAFSATSQVADSVRFEASFFAWADRATLFWLASLLTASPLALPRSCVVLVRLLTATTLRRRDFTLQRIRISSLTGGLNYSRISFSATEPRA
jgi:hypothetical protein